MNFAQLVDGAPVEIAAGWPFATTTLLIQTDEDAEAFGASIGDVVDCEISHAANALELLGEEGRVRFGVLPIVEPDPAPEGQVIASTALELVEGQVRRVAIYETAPSPVVPTKVHKLWLVKVLIGRDEMDAVDDLIQTKAAAGDKGYKRYWEAVSEIYRNDLALAAFAYEFGWSAADVDERFIEAAAFAAAVTP